MRTAKSERENAHRNMARAYFMKRYGNFVNPPELVLDNYCRQCATEMICAQLAQATMSLGNDGLDIGRNGTPGEQFLAADEARRVNALMLTCGAYDAAGDSLIASACRSKPVWVAALWPLRRAGAQWQCGRRSWMPKETPYWARLL
jgi:glutaminase